MSRMQARMEGGLISVGATRPAAALIHSRSKQAYCIKPTYNNQYRKRSHSLLITARAASGGSKDEPEAVLKLKAISKGAVQKKAARDGELEEAQAKLAATLKELEVATQEAATAEKLRQEVEARTAAMTNLQAQLEQVEALRTQELQASVKRFEELESALSLAEGSMGSEAQRVKALEETMANMAAELAAAAKQAEELRRQVNNSSNSSTNGASSGAADAKLKEQLDRAAAVEAGLKADLASAAEVAKKLTAEVESLTMDLKTKDAELNGARRISEEVAKAAESSEMELKRVYEELKVARERELTAAARAQELEVAAKKEADACAELISKAEQLAAVVGERLAAAAEQPSSSDEEDEAPGRDLGSLTIADVEAILDELEFLRGELEAEMQQSEDLVEKADSAEKEATELRKQLAALAAAGDESTTSMGGFSQTLVQELATSRAATAASEAQMEPLRVTNKALTEEVARLRAEAQNGPAEMAAKVLANRFSGQGQKELAVALQKIAELEKVNAELRQGALVKDAALAEGRRFLHSYLERSVSAADAAVSTTSSE